MDWNIDCFTLNSKTFYLFQTQNLKRSIWCFRVLTHELICLTCFRNENTKNKTLWGQESSFSKTMVPHNLLKYRLLLYDTSLQLIQNGFVELPAQLHTGPHSVPFLVFFLSCPQPFSFFSAYSNHRQSLRSKGNSASLRSLTWVYFNSTWSLFTEHSYILVNIIFTYTIKLSM